MLRHLAAVFCVFAFVFAGVGIVSATTYTFYDLGLPTDSTAGGAGSLASGINSSNEVVGRYWPASGSGPCLWKLGAGTYTRTIIPSINGLNTAGWANAINDNGTVVGQSSASSPNGNRAFLWTPGVPNGTTGTNVDVGLKMNGTSSSRLEAINSSGKMVGYGSGAGIGAYYWDGVSANATQIPMGAGNGQSFAFGAGINDSGLVVGTMNPAAGGSQVCTWNSNTPGVDAVNLGDYFQTALCPPGLGGSTLASGVNNAGQICGWDMIDTDTDGVPFLYQDNTHIYNLGLAAPAPLTGHGHALAISSNGTVVGYNTFSGGGMDEHAFVWTPSTPNGSTGTMVDLNSVVTLPPELAGYHFYEATGINSAGSVVGRLYNGTSFRAFALVAVPEPSTVLLAATGLIGLIAYAWRKRK